MQRVTLPAAILQGKGGPGMVRLEYIGPYAGGVTVQVPGGSAFVLSQSIVNKFMWATEAEAKWLIQRADCKRVVEEVKIKQPEAPFQVQPIVSPKLEVDKPVPTPTADKIEAMVEPAPPTVKEARKRGRKPKAK